MPILDPDTLPEAFTPFDPALTLGRWIPVVNHLRDHQGLFRVAPDSEQPYAVLTTYADVAFAFRRPDLYSNCPLAATSDPYRLWSPVIADPSQHRMLRAITRRYLSNATIMGGEHDLRRLLLPILDALLPRGCGNLTTDLCLPFSAAAVMAAFHLCSTRTPQIIKALCQLAGGAITGLAHSRHRQIAADQVREYFAELVAETRTRPRGHLVGDLCTSPVHVRPFTDHEVAEAAMLLVGDSFETTAYATAYALLHLALSGTTRRRLAKDIARLPDFIEEVIRYEAPVKAVGRQVILTHHVGGQTMSSGERAMLLLASANRDPTTFSDPDRFKADRRPNGHFGFGGGEHRCTGTHISRLVIKITIQEWLRRVTDFDVALDEVTETPGSTWGLSVPARWTTDRRQ
jgi:cytochrome P450